MENTIFNDLSTYVENARQVMELDGDNDKIKFQKMKAHHVIDNYENGYLSKLPYHVLINYITNGNYNDPNFQDDPRFQDFLQYLNPDDATKFFCTFENDNFNKTSLSIYLLQKWMDLDFFTSRSLANIYAFSVPKSLSNILSETKIQDYKKFNDICDRYKHGLQYFSESLENLYQSSYLTGHYTIVLDIVPAVEEYYLDFLSRSSVIDEAKLNEIKNRWEKIKKSIREKEEDWQVSYKDFMIKLCDVYDHFCREYLKVDDTEKGYKEAIGNAKKNKDKMIAAINDLQSEINDENIATRCKYTIDFIKNDLLKQLSTEIDGEKVDEILHRAFNSSQKVTNDEILEEIAKASAIMDLHRIAVSMNEKLGNFSDEELGLLMVDQLRNMYHDSSKENKVHKK